MKLGVFAPKVGALYRLVPALGLYANVAIAWMMAVVADLVINKPLGLSPPQLVGRTVHGVRRRGKYLLLFDPLDGSSNIDVNVAVGTIFSVLRCPEGVTDARDEHFLQPGTAQVAAGYCIYGPSTMLVLTIGHGTHAFTLDREQGGFVLTQKDMRIPEETREFAINMSNQRHWEAPMQHYVGELLAGQAGARGKDFNMRWIASMVAEAHRILMRGGALDSAPLRSRSSLGIGADGLILVDTKYEFGAVGNTLYVIDEMHTPDSSRFWRASESFLPSFAAWTAAVHATFGTRRVGDLRGWAVRSPVLGVALLGILVAAAVLVWTLSRGATPLPLDKVG